MKKSTKIILLVTALLTIAIIITAITMLKAVSGDALLYMNSKRGSFYAHSYRWFCLASIVMALFWVVLIIVKRKAIAGSFARKKEKKEEEKKEAGKKATEKKETEKKAADKETAEKKAADKEAADKETAEKKETVKKEEMESKEAVEQNEAEDTMPMENALQNVPDEAEESAPPNPQHGDTEGISQAVPDGENATSVSKAQNKEKENAVKEKKSRFCVNCGKQISGNDKFCGFCGEVVKIFDGPGNEKSSSDASDSPADASEGALKTAEDNETKTEG